MDIRNLFRLSVMFVLGQMPYRAVTQQCFSEASTFGWMLRRHIYHAMMAELGHECVSACQKDDRCQSFNFVISVGMCEFSDRTKEARPEEFIPDPDRYYYRRAMNRVPLGSIPELPAESCKEIKASEGQVVSGKYWLSSIKPGMSLLAHCDMATEDVDECSASSPVCDVNAKCKNTRGSYRCTCNTGFTGDGKTCKDIDECSASPPVCNVNASCQNNAGSYLCSCNVGFTGNGKNCTDINECNISPAVCDVNADCQNNKGSYRCSCKLGYIGDGRNCTPSDFKAVFTNLGTSGRLGPTSLGNYYSGQGHDGQVKLASGIQQWTVPYTGDYRIEAIGATGGYDTYINSSQYRGRGAKMIGTFQLSRGETIQILVGQEGGINNRGSTSGGGGGTFVVSGSNTPLIIAGGGGGIESAYSHHIECDASASTAGRAGYRSWSGGSGGHGAKTADSGNSGGGGGGFYSNGRSSTQFGGSMGNGGEGGQGFLQGGVGGRSWYYNAVGGFGGGGGAYGGGGGAGGGGGYSGGSSGDNEVDSCGGGGGSYNAGKNQQNECCYNSAGHGQVTITLV